MTPHTLPTLPADPAAALPSELLDVALAHAGRGWAVFPLVPGGKRPALHRADRCPRAGPCAGGHRTWEQRATTDPDRIRRAWAAGRAYNVGLPCGPAGLVVVDLDTPDPTDPDDVVPPAWADRGVRDGAGVLTALAADSGQPIPPTRTVATPSGGAHLYFLAPAGPGAPQLRNTTGDKGRGLGWKVDTRAHGGYVVAAGSHARGGGAYLLTDTRDPSPLPGWLLRRLTPPQAPPVPVAPVAPRIGGSDRRSRYLAGAIGAEVARVESAPRAQRNATLYVAAVALGQLVAGGALPESEVRDVLHRACAGHVAVRAYSTRQAEQTITSGLAAGARRPRRVAA